MNSLGAFIRVIVLLHFMVIVGSASVLPPDFIETDLGSGWKEPTGIAFDPSPDRADRLYVWERAGKVWIVENGAKRATPLIDISEEVSAGIDLGMLGFALHPNYAQNGYIYLFYMVDRHHLFFAGTPSYDASANDWTSPTIGRITRYTVRASDGFRSIDPSSRKVMLGETKATGVPGLMASHNVGMLAFGSDGTLLASCGDGASFELKDDGGDVGSTRPNQALAEEIISAKENVGAFRAQLVDSHNGKILRMDPETGNGVPGNPFYDASAPRAPRSRVWALGLRNPYRFTVRPETGSHDPTMANPGVIVVGDPGWNGPEEVDVIERAGQNFGWPLFEGLTANSDYSSSNQVNLDSPNPLGGHFRFRDLLVQETLGTPSWPNPANPQEQVPGTLPRFMHRRPALDYARSLDPMGPARTGTFNGVVATETLIGAPNSPTAGHQFAGNCSTGGPFYSTTDFPAQYHGTYFFADHGYGWIKNLVFGADQRAVEVRDFASVDSPVCLATHPQNGGLYYVNYYGNAVRRIDYAPGGSRPPIARASANVTFGSSPLTVTFSSAASSDPDVTTPTFLWIFGDGTTSTAPHPVKTFTAADAKRFTVTLRASDSGGAFTETALPIFVNHTPPAVDILSPVNGTRYASQGSTSYELTRRVTAAPGRTTSTRWQVFLHHDAHEHAEMLVDAEKSTALITPVQNNSGVFYHRVVCTVTDDLGASTQAESILRPITTNAPPALTWRATNQERAFGLGPVLIDADATITDIDSAGVEFGTLQLSSSVPEDALSLMPQGDASGEINVAGREVRYGGVVVGTLTDTPAANPLVVIFSAPATPAIAQALLRRVAVQCIGGGTHSITATFSDGDGGTSPPATLVVNVRNESPSVSLTSPSEGALYHTPEATIVLTASASDRDGSVARVEFFSGTTKLAEDADEPYSLVLNNVPAGTYSFTARATDDRGAQATSESATVTVESDTVLPAVWQSQDVGLGFKPGTAEFLDGTYTLTSSGSGYARSDSFQFLSQSFTGDGEIIVRVADLQSPSSSALGGVMIREGNGTANRHALLALNASGAATFQWRAQPSSNIRQKVLIATELPNWLRLVRHETRCTGYTSADGVTWDQAWSIALQLKAPVLIGLAVSGGGSDGATARASFDHVVVRPLAFTSQPPVIEITEPSNGATFPGRSFVPFMIKASDPDGGIARVDLMLDGKKLATDNKAPFAFVWRRAIPGTHTFTARAVDFTGSRTTSQPVTITSGTP